MKKLYLIIFLLFGFGIAAFSQIEDPKYWVSGYPDLNKFAVGLTVKVVGVCLLFLTICIIIAYVYNIAVTLFSSKGKSAINFSKLGRVAVMSFFLVCYVPVTYTITELMKLMAKATKEELLYEDIDKIFNTDSKMVTSDEDEKPEEKKLSFWDSILDYMDKIVKTLTFNVVYIFSDLAWDSLKTLIRWLFAGINQQLIILFFVLGPFACLFSVLPGFEGKFMAWLTTYLTFLFVPIVFNVLDLINRASFNYMIEHSDIIDMMGRGLVNLCSAIMYCMSFWIAGKIVGATDAGRFVSFSGQLAAMGAGMAAKLGATKFGGGAMGMGGGNVSNAASASQDAMSN